MKKFLKWSGIVFVSLIILCGIFLVTNFSYNKYTVEKWFKNPHPRGKMVNIGPTNHMPQ